MNNTFQLIGPASECEYSNDFILTVPLGEHVQDSEDCRSFTSSTRVLFANGWRLNDQHFMASGRHPAMNGQGIM